MEEKKELVVYGENGQIIDCDFERLDPFNPSTILKYASDVKQAISDVLDTTAGMSISEDDGLTNDMIESIASFGDTLDKSDEQKEKNSKGIRKVLSKIGLFKPMVDTKSYKDLFTEYCEKIEEVRFAVAKQLENTKNDVNLRQEIINEMLPHIEKLERMIEVGKIDMKAFSDHIDELKTKESNLDLEYEIQYKTQILGIVNSKIDELEKALILYKQQIQAYRLQTGTDTELALRQQGFLENDSRILKSQGSIMAFNRIQSGKIEKAKALDTATNQAVIQNAQELQVNAQAAVELSVKGGITAETMGKLQDVLGKGAEILRNGKKQKQEQIARNRDAYNNMNKKLQEYNAEFLNLVEVQNIQLDAIEAPQDTKAPQDKVKQKKLFGNK